MLICGVSLFQSIIVALPFLGARIMYTIIGTFDRSVNSYTGPIALLAILIALMEFVVTVDRTGAGILTRKITEIQENPMRGDAALREQSTHKRVARP